LEIPQSESVYALKRAPNAEFGTHVYRFIYESPITPETVYDYDVRTHETILAKRQEVPGGYDSSRYATERIFATSTDGTSIPVSLVFKKNLPPGPHPTLLYGYGSYGMSIPLSFSSNRVSFLDRGGVWALAHVRGGGDLGTTWHDGARMATKMNTFTDFIACAEELIRIGRTAPEKLAIQGLSAGGLLMGAVTNLRPDLWKAVVAQVPFVDVINSMLDESLPLTVSEFEEWGNPKNREQYEVMARYSPYDNIAPKDYPAMLVMTAYNDSQVMYWEPAKYVARLRSLKTDKHPLLLRINMEPAGHDGHSGRYDRIHEEAFWMAFVLDQLGITR
jgi:oligopeptidase B